MMRNVISMLGAALCMATLSAPVTAADMTIKGSVVCFPSAKEPNVPAPDAASTLACAKKGMPVGVKTADAVYRISGDYVANNNAKLLDFVSRIVIATGEVSEKDGQKMMNAKSIKLAPPPTAG